jgi:toxin-antitoxin system PIN domain toxin
VIAVDASTLVYAHMRVSPFHDAASAWMKELVEGRAQWAIPWPCVHEFLSIATNPRIYSKSSSRAAAIAQVNEWMKSPSLTLLHEERDHWPTLVSLLDASGVRGAAIHDARIAAICMSHGVDQILTQDRDFARFRRLKVLRLGRARR